MAELSLEKVAQIFLLDWDENGCQLLWEHFLQLSVYHQILDLNLSGYTMVLNALKSCRYTHAISFLLKAIV